MTRPLNDAEQSPDQDNVCDTCGCYWDTPQHYYGCPVAVDELTRLTEELGLYECPPPPPGAGPN